MDKVLVFDLKGPMAHFRKFDTNSSSLSYYFPPRTAVAGLVAGLIGMEKESYEDSFSTAEAHIGLEINTNLRKLMQTVNYMKVKSRSEFNGSGGPTQIPVEYVLPEIDAENCVTYRIYFSHNDAEIYETLKKRLENGKYVYPPYLGVTEMLGLIIYHGEYECEFENNSQPVYLNSVCLLADLQERSLVITEGSTIREYQKEHMPRALASGRKLQEVGDYIFEKYGRLKAIPKYGSWLIGSKDKCRRILFM